MLRFGHFITLKMQIHKYTGIHCSLGFTGSSFQIYQQIFCVQITLQCNEGVLFCVVQVSELCDQVRRLQSEKEELERELDTQANHTHKQVSNLCVHRVCRETVQA